jgi:hypothetical protein
MAERRHGEPEITAETVGKGEPRHRKEGDGLMRYIGSQLGVWVFVVLLFVAGLIAIIVYANVY